MCVSVFDPGTSSTKEDAEGKKQGNSEEDSRKEDGKSSNSSSLAGENSVREKCRQMIANALKTPCKFFLLT